MKLLREPLVHFAIAGLVLFSVYSWLNGSRPASDGIEPVRIGAGEIQWLKETYSSQWLRPPDADELQGLVADLVNEELLAREAQAMGLGEDDTIIRRRLAQKLKFLVEDTSRLAEPSDAELRQYFEENAARFEDSPRVSFSQIYFNPENRKDAADGCRARPCRAERASQRRCGGTRRQVSARSRDDAGRPASHREHVRGRVRRCSADGRNRQMEWAAEVGIRHASRIRERKGEPPENRRSKRCATR